MREAVIVSTARTPIGKATRGAFNITHGATLAGHVVEHAVARAGIDPAEVEDVVLGCAMPEGATGKNIGRMAAMRAGLPTSVAGLTVNRFCSSGLQAIAIAAQRVTSMDRVPVMVAGGVESISLVQRHRNKTHDVDDWLLERQPALWMSMIETADPWQTLRVSREAQDEYAAVEPAAHGDGAAGRLFRHEIVPLRTIKEVTDKDTARSHARR